jgi:hypothetical protein
MVVLVAGRQPLISAEEVLIKTNFGRPYDSAEAVVYGQ